MDPLDIFVTRILFKYTCLWTWSIACEGSQIHLTFGHASTQVPRLVVSEVLVWHTFFKDAVSIRGQGIKTGENLRVKESAVSEVNVVVICSHNLKHKVGTEIKIPSPTSSYRRRPMRYIYDLWRQGTGNNFPMLFDRLPLQYKPKKCVISS